MADVGIKITAIDATQGAFNSIDRSLGGLKAAAAGVSGSLAGLTSAFTVGGFVAFVKSVNDGVDALNDIKDATGASIENISALEDIAKRTGTSLDTVGSALVKLNQALNTAKPGSDTEKALTAIGLSVKDLKNLDPAEAFRRIAVELNKFADDGNKARLSQELFGKSLKEVAPLLKDVAESGALVATVTTEQAEAAEAFNKQIFAMQKNVQDLSRLFLKDLVPAINEGATRFALAYKNAGGLLETLALYFRLDYSKGIQGNLSEVEKQIAQLEERAGRITSDGGLRGNARMIEQLKAQATYLKELRQIKLLENTVGNQSDAETRRLTGAAGRRSVGELPAGPDKAAIAAAAAAAKAARALAIKEEIEEVKRMQSAQEAYDKVLADSTKEREKYNETYSKSADAVAQKVQDLEDEEAALALSTSANISLAQAIERVEIARLREKQAIELSYGNEQAAAEIQREIEQRQKLATLIDSKEARTANTSAAKEAADAWQKSWEETDKLAREAFTGWAENGTSMAEAIGKSLKKALLSAIYEATIKPIAFQLYSSIAGGATGAAGADGALGQASGIKGVYDAISGGFTAFGAKVGGAFASFAGSSTGASLGLSTATTFAGPTAGSAAGGYTTNALSSGSQSTASFLKGAAGWIGLGMAASASLYDGGTRLDSKGRTLDPVGGSADALLRGLGFNDKWAAILSGSLLAQNITDKIFGTGRTNLNEQGIRGTLNSKTGADAGGYYITQTDRGFFGGDGLEGTGKNGGFTKDEGLTAFLNTSIFAVTTSVKEYAKVIGLSADAVDGFSKTIDVSIKDLDPAAQQKAIADAIGSFGEDMVAAVYGPALEAVKRFDETSSSQTLTRLGQDLTAVNSAFALMGTTLVDASLQGAASASKIVDAFGGLEKFAQSLGSYYENFYSDAEKRAGTVGSITSALNGAGGNFTADQIGALTRDAFRAIVESTKAELGADSPLYVALINASGAFASITPAVEAAADAARSLADIANERKTLQNQLDDLTLSSVELLTKQRNALDESNRALFDQVQAATAAKAAVQAFGGAMEGLATTRFDLENQLLSLQGQSSLVASRTRTSELESLTEGITNPDDIARIQAQYDYNESLRAQVAALNAAQQAAADYASQQQQAASAAANAAEQVRSAWQSVTDSLIGEARRIRGLLGTPAQSFAQAQAAFSITAAQASAGDQTAAKALPELSRVLLSLAEAQATSLVQLQTIQGTTAGTLEAIAKKYVSQFGVDIPQFAVGTNYVPEDMLAYVHKGEAIVPAAYNPANAGGSGNGALLAEMQALRAQVAALQALQSTGNDSAKITADTLRRVTRGGDAMQTQEFV